MQNKTNYSNFLKENISDYLKRFLEESKKVIVYDRKSDIEPLHRMRVASRRLRVALKFLKFLFSEPKLGVWEKDIRKISRALGRARQLDVQIKFLKDFKKQIQDDSQATFITNVIDYLEKKRDLEQRNVCRKIKYLSKKKSIRDLKKWLEDLLSSSRTQKFLEKSKRKKKLILKRMNKLLKFSNYAYIPEYIEKLHRMRIAAKNLRYTLEIIKPVYGEKIDEFINVCHKIQDLLGQIHDYDVLKETLVEFLDKKKKTDLVEFYLLKRITELRNQSYKEFILYWEELQKAKIFEKLTNLV